MTCKNEGPVFCAPDEDRCEGYVKARREEWTEWAREPHRCTRRAEQVRDGRLVCYQHAALERVRYWDMNSTEVTQVADILAAIEKTLEKRTQAQECNSRYSRLGHLAETVLFFGKDAEDVATDELIKLIDNLTKQRVEALREQAKTLGHEVTDAEISAMEATERDRVAARARNSFGVSAFNAKGGVQVDRIGHAKMEAQTEH